MDFRLSVPRPVSAVFLALLMLTAPFSAGAQTASEKAGARSAATSGADAYDAGNYVKAIDLFTRAESIVHSPVHELYLARSYVKLGRFVEGRELYLKIGRENKDERGATAQKELSALEPRIPSLTLHLLGTEAKEPAITLDGKPYPAALVGVAQPFDPGDHSVVVEADGRRLTRNFSVQEAEKLALELDMAEGEIVPAEVRPEPVAPPVVPAPEKKGADPLRVASYASMGVGAVGIGLGVVFSIVSGDKANQANALCDQIDDREGTSNCAGRTSAEEAQVLDLESSHESAQTAAIVSYIAGGVFLGAGVTLFVLSGPKNEGTVAALSSARRAPAITPIVGMNYWGIKGRF